MAKSSIHIATGNAGYLSHNDRSRETKNSIFQDEANECSHTEKEAFEIYREELAIRSKAYSTRTKQNLQKKAITHLSAIVNLNSTHTLKNMQPLLSYIEKSLDTKIFQVAIHRDEGHIDEDTKEELINEHAHIEMMGLDSTGASVRKKLTKKYLSDLQTKTAELLQMERGTNYAKEKKKRPKRLDTYEYKREAEKIAIEKRATIADVKAQFKAERQALIDTHQATKEDYTALRKKYKELEAEAKRKELTIAELKRKIRRLEEENIYMLPIEIEILKERLAEKPKVVEKIVEKEKIKEVLNPINRELEEKVHRLEKDVYSKKYKTIVKPAKNKIITQVGKELENLFNKTKTTEADKNVLKNLGVKHTEKVEKKPARYKDVVIHLEKTIAEMKLLQKPKTIEKTIKVENPLNVELKATVKELEMKLLQKPKTIEKTIKVENPLNVEMQTENEALKQENNTLKTVVSEVTSYLKCTKDQILERIKSFITTNEKKEENDEKFEKNWGKFMNGVDKEFANNPKLK